MHAGTIVVLIAVFAQSVFAAPPSGYQCAPGTPNKGVGCTCPADHTSRLDAEDIATCVAVPKPTAGARFIKHLEQSLPYISSVNEFEDAAILALQLDAGVDTKAIEVLTAAFNSWLKSGETSARVEAMLAHCSIIDGWIETGNRWRRIWENAMTRLDRRVPASRAKETTLQRIDKQLEPFRRRRDECIAQASKQDGSNRVAGVYARCSTPDAGCPLFARVPKAAIRMAGYARQELDRCFAKITTPYTIMLAVVIDGHGKMVKQEITAVPAVPAGRESDDPRNCVAEWLRRVGNNNLFLNKGGFAATLTIDTVRR